jgi:hypothetical protein
VDFDLGLVFPDKLGGLSFDRVEKYNNADLGYSVFYKKSDTFGMDLSVYNLGSASIPDGIQQEQVDRIVRNAETRLKWRQKSGEISNLQKRGTTVVPKKGEIKFSNTVFQYKEFRLLEGTTHTVQKIHSVYVTGARGNFIKMEFAFDLIENKVARSVSKRMVQQVIEILKTRLDEEGLLMAACDAAVHDPAGHGGRTAAQHLMAKAKTMENLNIYPHLFVWPTDYYSKPKNADLLVAAYFAGMIKVVVPQNLDEGGEREGFASMLAAYQALRAKEQIKSIPQFDEWSKVPDKNALFERLLIEE